MDLIFLYIITFFELYIFNTLTSCIIWTKANKNPYKNKILFIRNYKERYKIFNKYGNLKKYDIHQKVWKVNSKLVSSFESPIVGINLGNTLKNKNKNRYLFFSQNSILNPNIQKSALKISLKLQKELFLGRNKNLVNTLLCLHYVPTISNSYLKKSLNSFRLSDLNVKENILYHLTLKYLYTYEQNTKDKNLLESINKNNYKFILQHSKTLKKITKHIQISEEKNRFKLSKKFDKLKNNVITTQSSNSWVENKVVDVYLKNRKKLNIIFINTKKKKNIFQTYKKIIGNIKYYDVYDKLIILNYLHKNKKYRECLLFFKKYIYNSVFGHNTQQKSKYFIINFINILNDNNILNIYLMRIHNSYNFLLKSILLSKIQDKHKLNFLQINVDNFIQENLKDSLYLGIKQNIDKMQNDNSNNLNFSNHNNTNLIYLFYINLLNIFLKKKNYYFPDIFLKQFYSYYMDNIYDHKIVNDEFFFFLITLAFSLKIFYLKKKGNITTYTNDIFEEYKENDFIGNSENKQNKKFETLKIFSHILSYNFNHVNIFDEDLFSSETINLTAPFEIVNKIINLNKLDEEIDIYKHFCVLILWQYLYLLRYNLKNIDFENVHFNIDKEQNQDNLSVLKEKKKDNIFSEIIKGYKKILNKKISTHPNEEILIYNQTFEELNFFIENYLTDIIDKNIKKKKEKKYILPDILSNLMHILSMRKINISFFFSVLYFLDLNNNKRLLKNLLKKKHIFKNINSNIKKLIIKRFRRGIQTNKQNEQAPFLYEYILSEYKEIYETYKNITNYSSKKDMKKLIKKITGNNERKHHFKIFKKPILALNLKQLFFIFYSLSHFKMDKEIISLFRHAIKIKYFKKKNFINIFKDKNEEKEDHTNNNSNIEEDINLYKKIFFIYHNSILSLDNSFYTPKSNKWGPNYSKYFFFYSNNPLHIYKYIANKYEEDLKKKQAYNPVKQDKNCRKYDNKIEDELEKIENIQFFGIKNIERIKKSKFFKKFFIDKIYNFINKNDYTLILNGLMKYLLKNVTTLRASQIEEKWGASEKKKKKKLWTKYIYLYFYLTAQCYLKTHKMSNIIFLILLKTSLLMNDIDNYNNLLLLNKELTHKNYMCINSMINSNSNMLSLNSKQNYIPILKIPIDMYIIHNEKLIIYNLNYFQVTKIIDNFINGEIQIIFFIDYRQTFINLINLDIFFNLSFFKNNKFIHFLNHHNLILNENNFLKKSKFVLFFGNCINKKRKIIKYFSKHYKNYNIQENKSIKDALIISVYD